MDELQIPPWTEEEKDAFVAIARRRKDEVALGYAVVAVGAQLFERITKSRTLKVQPDGEIEPAPDASAGETEN